MEAPRVFVIGRDHWARASLRAELIERGFDAVGHATIRDALLALALSPARAPKVIVVDLHEQDHDEDRLAALFLHGARVIGIAGAAEAADADRPWAAFLRRPVTIGGVAEAVERAAA
ncbi:MAG TPA: hypothetical protein VHL80_03645 [Polyangia bacterium]|nr:hypothetical protein [Polyangia bacterium]